MIRFFNVNDPYRLLVVLFFMVAGGYFAHRELNLITIPELKGLLIGQAQADGGTMYSEIRDSTPPLAALGHRLMFSLAGKSLALRHAITVAVFFFQAAFFGFMLIRNRAFDQPGYLPSLLFAALLFYSVDSIAFTREVWASTILLLALDRILRQIQFRDQQASHLNSLGILIGLSTLFDFTYLVFFPAILLILIITSRMDGGRVLLYTVGFLFPHVVLMTWYFIQGNLPELLSDFYLVNFRFTTQSYFSMASLLTLSALPFLFMLFGFLKGRGSISQTRYQSQIALIMGIWFVTGLIETWLTRQRSAQVLVICIPPVAYFIHAYLIRIRRNWIARLMAWILVIGVPFIGISAIRGNVPNVDYGSSFVEQGDQRYTGKTLLVLSNDIRLYQNGAVCPQFPDWELARPIFQQPRYYENMVILDRTFRKNPPDVIIDPENLMPEIFRLLPETGRRYVRSGSEYILK